MTGFISIYKEKGINSTKPVAAVKRRTGEKCGHMGTLDPLASGVLPVGVGQAVRLFDYLLNKKKTYVASFRFGSCTDTLDTEGEIVKSGCRIPEKDEIMRVLGAFSGEIEQVPPRFSAKLVDGVRGYKLARRGVEFEISPKKVYIDGMALVGQEDEDTFTFRIDCRGGTYIRSIARDMGEMLGTCAYMTSLERTRSGVFCTANSVSTEQFIACADPSQYLIPADAVLDFKKMEIGEKRSRRMLNGLFDPCAAPDGLYRLYCAGSFIGVGEVENSILRVKTYVRDM